MCISPKRRWNEKRNRFENYPCGYCYQCVRKKKMDWEFRLLSARRWADCAFFKLLTFDPEHYPTDDHDIPFLKRQLQLFIKRLRITLQRKFGEDIELKYFIASEYGERKNRLHYHCIFFIRGAKFTWVEFNGICRKLWNYGIVGNCYSFNAGYARYCVKYIQKQYNFKMFSQFRMKDIAPDLPKKIRSEFSMKLMRYPSVPLAGKRIPLPSWWCRQIFGIVSYHTYKVYDVKRSEWKTKTVKGYKFGDRWRGFLEFLSDLNPLPDDWLSQQCRFENKEGQDMGNKDYVFYNARDGLDSNFSFYDL